MPAIQKVSGSVSSQPRPMPALYQLVTVYAVNNLVQAEIIQNALYDEGIACFLEGENQAGGFPALEIKIQVPVADAGRARKLIASHQHDR